MTGTKDLWVEKYRPKTIEDCTLPARLKKELQAFIADGEITSLMVAGPAGTGQTTAAKALCNELGCDSMIINCSEERGIDVVRNQIKSFAATCSLTSDAKHKVLILDEADNLTHDSQKALRGMVEEFWKNCRFIFTCNFKNRILYPLHSRCAVVDFAFSAEERNAMMASFMKRTMMILKENGVTFDPTALGLFIRHHFPDFRRTLNELQKYGTLGSIDEGILKGTGEDVLREILAFLKAKDFNTMRKWVDENNSLDVPALFDKLYDRLPADLKPQSIPDLILILDEYQNKATVVVNQRINMAACLTQMMGSLQWK